MNLCGNPISNRPAAKHAAEKLKALSF